MTNQSEMQRIAAHLPSKSEKIRQLGQAGYSRQQIADFLGIRYQHVRNVLVDAQKKAEAGAFAEPRLAWRAEQPGDSPGRCRVQADGSATIPAATLANAGFKSGDPVLVHIKGDGEIHLLSRRAGIVRAQALIRQFVPEGASLVDELIEERRREVGRENG